MGKKELGTNETLAAINKGKDYVKTVVVNDVEYGRGEFIFHRPTIFERQQIGLKCAERLQYVDQKSIDDLTRSLAYMAATIDVCCDSAPKWFDLDELYAIDLITKVFREVNDWINSFRSNSKEADKRSGGVARATGDMDGGDEI